MPCGRASISPSFSAGLYSKLANMLRAPPRKSWKECIQYAPQHVHGSLLIDVQQEFYLGLAYSDHGHWGHICPGPRISVREQQSGDQGRYFDRFFA